MIGRRGHLLSVNMLSWAGFPRMPFFAFSKVGRVGFPERERAVFVWVVGAFNFFYVSFLLFLEK